MRTSPQSTHTSMHMTSNTTTTTSNLDQENSSSSSPSSSSSSPSSSPRGPADTGTETVQAIQPYQLPPKRRAGRKKFHETRHPVYRGVRARNGGSRWVCEVREPHKKTRIWLGTYPIPEMAARAHDVAAIALRGPSAELNFQDSAAVLPRARSATPEDIRIAALQAAEMFRPADRAKQERIFVPESAPALALPELERAMTSSPVLLEEEAGSEESNVKDGDAVYVDEEEIFGLPVLMEDMAIGMMLSPLPAMERAFVDWDENDAEHMDYGLWTD